MNSKRQRRPNVRLGDIGDVSASFARGVSEKTKRNLGNKRWKHDFVNPNELEYNSISYCSQQRLSEFTSSDPGVSPRILTDLQQNRENNNPNSINSDSNFASLVEIDERKSQPNFVTTPPKCTLMKRGRRTIRSKRVFGGPSKSQNGLDLFNSEDGKEYGEKEAVEFALGPCLDICHDSGFNDFPDHETSAMIKEACENVNQGEDFIDEGNIVLSQSFGKDDNIKGELSGVSSVRRWLLELGFGKYAGVFEMHEVDEEALPLLTLEDLKEMGVVAVGHRRKLYTAIHQLREDRERFSA